MSKVTRAQATREGVLLLPGMTLNATVFPPLPAATLSIDFATLEQPMPDGMLGYARALDTAARDEGFWEFESRIVVGHSFGGMLALQWLTDLEEHESVSGAVLIGTSAGPLFDRARLRVFGVGRYAFRIPTAALMPVWNHALLTRAVKRLLNRGTLDTEPVDFASLGSNSDLAVGIAGWRNTHWQARRSFRMAMKGFDVRHRLDRLEFPIIVLHGGRDSFFSIETAQELTDALPNAELRVAHDAAHLLPLTHGNMVVDAVTELLHPPRGAH